VRMPTACRVVAVMLALGLVGCDTFDSDYATHADAVAAEQVAKGWIPAWVPPDATNIREVHNLDSNTSALSFELPPGARSPIPADCSPVEFGTTSPLHFERSWWPTPEVLEAEFSFFHCRPFANPHVFAAVRRDGRQVLHWRSYAY
jgi:hypothetical protein